MSQGDFTHELLMHLFIHGYKVTALEAEDFYDH